MKRVVNAVVRIEYEQDDNSYYADMPQEEKDHFALGLAIQPNFVTEECGIGLRNVHVRAKIKGEKKIYYTATALYNNDENHSAESGVFSSEKKAMEWLEKQAKQWQEDQGIDDEDFELRIESRKVNAYDSGTCLYSFEGTVGEAYMDNPEGPLTDVLKLTHKSSHNGRKQNQKRRRGRCAAHRIEGWQDQLRIHQERRQSPRSRRNPEPRRCA